MIGSALNVNVICRLNLDFKNEILFDNLNACEIQMILPIKKIIAPNI